MQRPRQRNANFLVYIGTFSGSELLNLLGGRYLLLLICAAEIEQWLRQPFRAGGPADLNFRHVTMGIRSRDTIWSKRDRNVKAI